MKLSLPLGRHAARRHFERRFAKVARKMLPLGGNVARIEVDEHDLGLHHVRGLGLPGIEHRARDDEERHARLGGPFCLRHQLCGQVTVRRKKGRVRRPVVFPLFHKGTHRHLVLAIAEHHVRKDAYHVGVWTDRFNRA